VPEEERQKIPDDLLFIGPCNSCKVRLFRIFRDLRHLGMNNARVHLNSDRHDYLTLAMYGDCDCACRIPNFSVFGHLINRMSPCQTHDPSFSIIF